MRYITTKYLGVTNSRGSRIKATSERGSITVPYDSYLNSEGNHLMALNKLCQKYSWTGEYVGIPKDRGGETVWIKRGGEYKAEIK